MPSTLPSSIDLECSQRERDIATRTDRNVSPPRLGSSAGSRGIGPFSDLGKVTGEEVEILREGSEEAVALMALLLSRGSPASVRVILILGRVVSCGCIGEYTERLG